MGQINEKLQEIINKGSRAELALRDVVLPMISEDQELILEQICLAFETGDHRTGLVGACARLVSIRRLKQKLELQIKQKNKIERLEALTDGIE